MLTFWWVYSACLEEVIKMFKKFLKSYLNGLIDSGGVSHFLFFLRRGRIKLTFNVGL